MGARDMAALIDIVSAAHRTRGGRREFRFLVLVAGLIGPWGCKSYEVASANGVSTLTHSSVGSSTGTGLTEFETDLGTGTTSPDLASCVPGTVQNCSTDALGNPVLFPGATPRGNCRYGVQTCNANGQWGACGGVVAPSERDSCAVTGDDANCNGAPNEGCECVGSVAASRPCGSSVGLCQQGVQKCVEGRWGSCENEVGPTPERCDGAGKDEDCDGVADLGDADCDCIDGQLPCTLPGVQGDCALGAKRCQNGQLSGCKPLRSSSAERCGNAEPDLFGRVTGDEDCDGLVDEENGPTPPLGCKIFIVDADNDEWGAIGPSFIQDQKNATYGCFCEKPPAALTNMVRGRPGRENQDCGDCATGDGHLVRPDQKEYFKVPSVCLKERSWKRGFFDYDCTGGEERRYIGKRVGRCLGDPMAGEKCRWSEDSTGFWDEDVTPACGEEALFTPCRQNRNNGKTCVIGTTFLIPAHQECR